MSEGTKLAGSESAQAAGPRFYVVSINKLIWLSLLSTGIIFSIGSIGTGLLTGMQPATG